MSLYSEQLAHLKKEIATIMSKKTKKLSTNQKIMYKFIHGATNKAVFTINDHTITLFHGDEKKGFRHILEKHYRHNDLEAMDILNIIDERYIKKIFIPIYHNLHQTICNHAVKV